VLFDTPDLALLACGLLLGLGAYASLGWLPAALAGTPVAAAAPWLRLGVAVLLPWLVAVLVLVRPARLVSAHLRWRRVPKRTVSRLAPISARAHCSRGA